MDLDTRCSPETEATAYFVASEGLTNAARHSRASQVQVTVKRSRSTLRLEVTDNGQGGANLGRGLQGLADRVNSVGGRLGTDTPPGGGTRLWAELPCG